jgi:hypothetical protein
VGTNGSCRRLPKNEESEWTTENQTNEKGTKNRKREDREKIESDDAMRCDASSRGRILVRGERSA